MPTATLKATPTPAGDTMTGIRIQRAVNQPGAKGKKGFLLWVASAFPPAMANPIIRAAAPHASPMLLKAALIRPAPAGPRVAGPTVTKMGRFGGFGDDANLVTIGIDQPQISTDVQAAINATDSAPATPSWLDSIGTAIQAAGQAYLTKTQVDAASQIFQTNLTRAQQGLPPIPTNPTAYGLPAPTVNFGLASSATTPLLLIGGGIALIILLSSLSKKSH
jgi:hypothetical protein